MNLSNTHTALLLTALTLTLAACGGADDKKTQKAKGASTSAPYELLVVADKAWLQSNGASDVHDLVYADMPCLPQNETWLRPTVVEPYNFKGVFQNYACILVADVNRKYAKADCRVGRDVYARPQTVVWLTAPTDADMAMLCRLRFDDIIALFNATEDGRARERLRKRYSGLVMQQAKRQFGCQIHAPEELNAIKEGKDFFWASSQGEHEQYWNLCLYTYPYTSPQTFTLDYFLHKRDSVMRVNVEGEDAGSYMSSDRRVMRQSLLTLEGHPVQEVRGLWQMERSPMGGPFVSYAQLDTLNGRVLVAEGFVYAPDKKKRDFVRQLEAALQTLTLPAAKP